MTENIQRLWDILDHTAHGLIKLYHGLEEDGRKWDSMPQGGHFTPTRSPPCLGEVKLGTTQGRQAGQAWLIAEAVKVILAQSQRLMADTSKGKGSKGMKAELRNQKKA